MDLRLDGAALTAQLVDIASVSGEEGPLTDAIEGALRSLPHLTVHRDGNAIVARTMLGRPERVILAGHVDTVPVAGNLPSRLEGSRLYGCGTTDMKSGVAVQLRLAASLTSPGRPGPDAKPAAVALHQAVRKIRARQPGLPALWAAHVHVGP